MEVSVCIISYNHEKFISESLNGVLCQETNFDFEIIIGDDCSTDETRGIIRNFQAKFPGKIKSLFPERNLGMMPNLIATLESCTGTFVALCEGDDYWTDTRKLQKQFDFLTANEQYSLCAHHVETKFEEASSFEKLPILPAYKKNGYVITSEILIRNWGLHTCSFFFKNNVVFPDWFEKVKAGDLALALILSFKGPIYLFEERMGVYRRHRNGVTAQASHMIPMYLSDIRLFQNFDKFTHYKYTNLIQKQVNYYNYAILILTAKRTFYAFYLSCKFILLNWPFSISDAKKIKSQFVLRKILGRRAPETRG